MSSINYYIKNLNYVKTELFNILRAIENNETDAIILDSYDEYNKKMLDFLKSKDKIWAKKLIDSIEQKIQNDYDKDTLKEEFLKYPNINKHLINHILDKIFDFPIYIDDSDTDNENENEIQINTHVDNLITNFKWRENQLKGIVNCVEQNFVSGVHNQIMGAGKSIMILKLIDEHFKKYLNNNIYVLTCFRQEILNDLFFDENNEIDENKIEFWKKNNIIDIDQYKVIDRVNIKTKKIKLSKTKPTILIVNTDFLKVIDRNNLIDYDDINFILLDECHAISADKLYKLLKKIKYVYKKSIIGFSATPLRQKAELKLVDIFSKTFDIKCDNKRLNIISNYDFMNAIKDDIILPPYFILCEINKTLNGKIGRSNKQIMKKILEDALTSAPYKKVIGWCRSIQQMKECYNFIKKNIPNLTIYCTSCVDSQLASFGFNTDIKKFFKETDNCILLCVNRCREGSDINNVDIAIYLDCVKKRSFLVAIQTSGRVLRKDKLNKKTHGIIIDSFVNVDGTQVEMLTAEKIIAYYQQVLSLCENDLYARQKEIYEQMSNLCNKMKYNETTNEIIVKIDDDQRHDVKFKLELTTQVYDWSTLKNKIHFLIEKLCNIEKQEKFDIIINKIKSFNIMNLNSDFWKVYDSIINKEQYGFPENSKLFYEEYKDFFDSKTWYELLNLDTSCWYQTINDCCLALKNIYSGKITQTNYFDIIKKDKKLPPNPIEFLKLYNFKNFNDFNDNNARSLVRL